MPRYVLITGGSRGIGRAAVRRFCAEGACVAFTYLKNREDALSLSRETGALAFPCDSRDERQVQSTCEKVLRLFHGLDVLVLNAGTALYRVLEATEYTEWQDQLDTHLTGAYLFLRELLPALREKRGAAVLVSSVWGQLGGAGEAAYSAAKAGLIGLTKALAREEAPLVRVNCVSPGIIATDMLSRFSDEEKAELFRTIPMERPGTPEEAAAAICFLCSEDASYITGQVLSVNGGMT